MLIAIPLSSKLARYTFAQAIKHRSGIQGQGQERVPKHGGEAEDPLDVTDPSVLRSSRLAQKLRRLTMKRLPRR
jgi:hypothetical protein